MTLLKNYAKKPRRSGKQENKMDRKGDKRYMDMALKLALKAADRTYPNPMVGAVIVKNGRVIGKGYHRRAGAPHAEINAIRGARESCGGSTMYVTLEPCDHYGKTPPCTEAIIKSGIKKVNIAMKDPNPANNGRGIKKLKKAGIKVNSGICAEDAELLNKKYIKFIKQGLPYVTVKLAQSLDGKIAAGDGSSKWISSGSSRKRARKMRAGFDAVVVGANTVLADDPYLLDAQRHPCDVARVVVDTRLRTPEASNLVKTAGKAPLIIGTTELAPENKIAALREKGVKVLVTKSRKGKVPLKIFFRALAGEGLVNILVEGGGELVGGLMDEKLIDEVMFFIAPKILGGPYSSIKGRGAGNIAAALDVEGAEVSMSGGDIFVRGNICSRV